MPEVVIITPTCTYAGTLRLSPPLDLMSVFWMGSTLPSDYSTE